jgi:hypothetical protein
VGLRVELDNAEVRRARRILGKVQAIGLLVYSVEAGWDQRFRAHHVSSRREFGGLGELNHKIVALPARLSEAGVHEELANGKAVHYRMSFLREAAMTPRILSISLRSFSDRALSSSF